MLEHANNFRLAHPDKCLARKSSNTTFGMVGQEDSTFRGAFRGGHGQQNSTFRGALRGGQNNRRSGSHRGGHQGSGGRGNQFHATQTDNGVNSDSGNHGRGRGAGHRRGTRGRGMSRLDMSVQCYSCKGYGHVSRVCPTNENANAGSTTGVANVALDREQQTGDASNRQAEESDQADVLCSAGDKLGSLPIADGCVNGFQVSVLRDSGATTAGVRRSLVRDDQYTGEQQNVISFGGNIECFPLAVVTVDTPFFTGDLKCCVIADPIADLIIGNLQGVEPIPGLIVGDTLSVSGESSAEPDVASVMTRAQTRAEGNQPTTYSSQCTGHFIG